MIVPGDRVWVVGGFRPARNKKGVVAGVEWVETTYNAGYVYTVKLDQSLIEPKSGKEANGFLFNESELEKA